MKKIVMLAISAILVANVFAQEQKKEGNGGKQFSKEERVEFAIKRFTNELMLNDEQAKKFAPLYREYAGKVDEIFHKKGDRSKCEKGKELTDSELDKLAKQRFEKQKELVNLKAKYYDKFRKDLSARQVAKVLHLDEPCGPKPCCDKRLQDHGHKHFQVEKQGYENKEFRR